MTGSRCRARLHWGVLWIVSVTAGFGVIADGLLSAQDMVWDRLADGLAVTVWEPGPRCGDEVPLLYLVQVDPERFRFSTYHFRDEGLPDPLTIQDWQRRTRARVLFNAGLFQDDYSYLGLLLKGGRSLGTKRHPRWHGLFVAEPVAPGVRKARVLDLAVDSFADDNPPYREAAQSLMLLDRTGKPRVRQTGKRAHQTVVGEDRKGNILLIKTADVVALWDLAECLRKGVPAIHQAMAMDGGPSSDLLIEADGLVNRESTGDQLPWHALVDGSGMRHIPLPSVIGVMPRDGAPQ
ncbi:MAG: phosphodiester glycosidase family protein [Nitrospirota bacterium]